jgi:hypothetical protein
MSNYITTSGAANLKMFLSPVGSIVRASKNGICDCLRLGMILIEKNIIVKFNVKVMNPAIAIPVMPMSRSITISLFQVG